MFIPFSSFLIACLAILLPIKPAFSGCSSDVADSLSFCTRNLFQCENHGSRLKFTIMTVYSTNIAIQSLPAFEFGVCLGEKLSAVGFSVAGFELYCFSFSFHVS